MKKKILDFLFSKFKKDDVVSVYGIGSAFENTFTKTSDVDVVVLLKDIDKAPSPDWATALFEKTKIDDIEVYYLYGDMNHYLNSKIFPSISFANWEWSIRGLKYGSTLLYGEDIRDQLPTPPFNVVQIFKRSMYHLEPTSQSKMDWAKRNGIELTSEQMRLSKSIFKYGFFLVACVYPDKNIFTKNGIYNLLKTASEEYRINSKMIEFYEQALKFREGIDFPDFKNYRKSFMKFAIREGMRHLHTTWKGNDEKKGISDLLNEGIGKKPFTSIFLYYKNFGM